MVSPVNMNVFYLEVDNPLKISVPGLCRCRCYSYNDNGNIICYKKSAGEWIARPTKKEKLYTLYADIDGKQTRMGEMEFRVKQVPPPKPYWCWKIRRCYRKTKNFKCRRNYKLN